jgi:thiol-disulfide isomerase/thioredoxin
VTKQPESRSGKWINWLVMAMAFVALYAWMTRGNASPLMGQPAPSLSLAVAAGAEPEGPAKVTLTELSGRVVVLDFWASWCGACRRSTPMLNELHAEFEGQQVAFYAVNVEPIDRQRLQAAHAAFGTEFPTLHDRAGTVQREYSIRSLPTVLVIDRDGVVQWASTGVPSKIRLRSAISEALN